jgi:rhamnogalacturonyl hydrolase YesR
MTRAPRILAVLLLLAPSGFAAPRHRASAVSSKLDRAAIAAAALQVANAIVIPPNEPRRHWENVPALDGMVLLGERLGNAALVERAANVILGSNDQVAVIDFGDRGAYAQVIMDLLRVLPANDPRRAQLLALTAGPMSFAEHAIRVAPDSGGPRDPWWIDGGYGTRFWQDDMYMVLPWLAMGDAHARDLAYEWLEAYIYDHRPSPSSSVATLRERNGYLLWDPERALFQHGPETLGTDDFWGRGNGWSAAALARVIEHLDAPYGGNRYGTVVDAAELRSIARQFAASLAQRRTPDGGWSMSLSRPSECGEAETSATALITFFLAKGVNDGWLDRDTYGPIAVRALALLVRRIDAEGNVRGIQQPGFAPACGFPTHTSNRSIYNVNYGPGALLLAASEVLRFSDEDLLRFNAGA